MRTAVTLAALSLLPGLAAAQLVDPSFESPTAPGGPAFALGQWTFDNSASVPTTLGIVPAHLNRMIQFINTSPGGPSGLVSCDVVQIVDLTAPAYQALITAGTAQANGGYLVNRIPQNAAGNIDTAFYIQMYAFSNLANAQLLNSPTASLSTSLLSDANPVSWEPLSLTLNLPTSTQYLGFRIGTVENVFNDSSGTEFDGHFGDMARLTIVPAPGAAALAGLGGLLAFRRRR